MAEAEIHRTTVNDLEAILQVPCETFNRWDQIIPGLFISDAQFAKDVGQLREHYITHVLNMAYIPPGEAGCVFSVGGDDNYYKSKQIKIHFKGINAMDSPSFHISEFFQDTSDFIETALKANGRVLVHCYVGVSRAATIVIAFLMIKKGYTVSEAVRIVRKMRHIHPNIGFLQQLCDLDSKINSGKRKGRVEHVENP